MPKLNMSQRTALPDSAFAYVDSRGRRHLPINDVRHVRNALARFRQVTFEDDVARERARKRLLSASNRHGIMPLGFITAEMTVRPAAGRRLPTGTVTFLLSDIESSTALVQHLGDRYGDLLDEVRGIHRAAIGVGAGHEVDARADEFFAVFESTPAAVAAAVAIQNDLRIRSWPDAVRVRVRMGLHLGQPTLTSVGYIGVDVHVASRISGAAHGGQILLSAAAREAIADATLAFRDLGVYRLRGLRQMHGLFQLQGAEFEEFPPLRATLIAGLERP
jgi:class 3 adenylate cyclase